ncbi:hypothetical protein PCIT_a1854 [Pseudoalteromonas citrea]|uniref:Uncharacterized protein n=1 Tax=Pseudoalteromonas citrea TaxID=43655 RepID=A0AAD4FS37_9GAMM|nr:hypothetical protein PCIT_a1854 [Pseudoalteromonas citrea]
MVFRYIDIIRPDVVNLDIKLLIHDVGLSKVLRKVSVRRRTKNQNTL